MTTAELHAQWAAEAAAIGVPIAVAHVDYAALIPFADATGGDWS